MAADAASKDPTSAFLEAERDALNELTNQVATDSVIAPFVRDYAVSPQTTSDAIRLMQCLTGRQGEGREASLHFVRALYGLLTLVVTRPGAPADAKLTKSRDAFIRPMLKAIVNEGAFLSDVLSKFMSAHLSNQAVCRMFLADIMIPGWGDDFSLLISIATTHPSLVAPVGGAIMCALQNAGAAGVEMGLRTFIELLGACQAHDMSTLHILRMIERLLNGLLTPLLAANIDTTLRHDKRVKRCLSIPPLLVPALMQTVGAHWNKGPIVEIVRKLIISTYTAEAPDLGNLKFTTLFGHELVRHNALHRFARLTAAWNTHTEDEYRLLETLLYPYLRSWGTQDMVLLGDETVTAMEGLRPRNTDAPPAQWMCALITQIAKSPGADVIEHARTQAWHAHGLTQMRLIVGHLALERNLHETCADFKPTILTMIGPDTHAMNDILCRLAADETNPQWLAKLLACGAPLEVDDPCARTPLLAAITARHEEHVSLLIAHGAKVNGDYPGCPLAHAVAYSALPIVKMLLDAGAHDNTHESIVNAAIHALHMPGGLEMVELLLAKDPSAVTTPKARTALLRLVLSGQADYEPGLYRLLETLVVKYNIDVVTRLGRREADINPNVEDQLGESPLVLAMTYCPQLPIMKLLIEHGATPATVTQILENPVLALSVMQDPIYRDRDMTALRYLLDHDFATLPLHTINRPHPRSTGEVPLTCALRFDNEPCLQLLLAHGDDVNRGVFNHSFQQPLLWTLRNKLPIHMRKSKAKQISQLLEFGAQIVNTRKPGEKVEITTYRDIVFHLQTDTPALKAAIAILGTPQGPYLEPGDPPLPADVERLIKSAPIRDITRRPGGAVVYPDGTVYLPWNEERHAWIPSVTRHLIRTLLLLRSAATRYGETETVLEPADGHRRGSWASLPWELMAHVFDCLYQTELVRRRALNSAYMPAPAVV